jgi:hypothetical protein
MIQSLITNKRYHVFGAIFFTLLFLYLWDDILSGNEAQTLANVFHFAHPEWLKNDWFLSLDTVYRIPFNVILYPLAKLFPLPVLAITGRIVLIFLMSYALTELFEEIPLSVGAAALFTLITFRMKGMLAGEDMLWHVEAKVLAYIFVVLAITAFLRQKHLRMWLFFGAAATFHPLVGGYSVISLGFIYFFLEKDEQIGIFKKSPFFLLTGWPGIGIVLYNLVTSSSASGGVSDLLYVARHHHHMVPTHFIRHVHKAFPEWMDISIIVGNVAFCLIVLGIAFFVLRRGEVRKKLLLYTAGSAVIFLIGLLLYFTGQYHFLKYYIFRFPDVILPFTAYLLFFNALDHWILNKKPILSRAVAAAILLATGGLFAIQTYQIAAENQAIAYRSESAEKIRLYRWIRSETPPQSKFIISPFIDNFHIAAERAQFVTFKHIPQNERDVMEWYRRLVQLNGGSEFYDGIISFRLPDLQQTYNALSDEVLLSIAGRYGMDYYIGPADRDGSLPRLYATENFGVYGLPADDKDGANQ